MRTFILLSVISFNAFALDWYDMESGEEYVLQQSFSLPQMERSGSLLKIQKGEKFELKEIIGIGMGMNLGLFNFHYKNCPGPAMETDIEIIPVEGTPVRVGAMVAENCELWVYVELKDFWTKSLFE